MSVIKWEVGVRGHAHLSGGAKARCTDGEGGGWPPSSPCVPSTQGLSAGEEAGVYQRYTQLCCPSVSAAQGDLALKRRPGNRSPRCLPASPSRPSTQGVGGGVCWEGESREEGQGEAASTSGQEKQ